jgi:hypothetical protein
MRDALFLLEVINAELVVFQLLVDPQHMVDSLILGQFLVGDLVAVLVKQHELCAFTVDLLSLFVLHCTLFVAFQPIVLTYLSLPYFDRCKAKQKYQSPRLEIDAFVLILETEVGIIVPVLDRRPLLVLIWEVSQSVSVKVLVAVDA